MANRDLPNRSAQHGDERDIEREDPYAFGPDDLADPSAGRAKRLTLSEETLEPHVIRKQIGEVLIHKSVESQTLRNEVDLKREHVSLEEMTVEEYVEEKRDPWYEDGMLVIPLYEEVLVTERKLMLTKLVRVRHEVRTEHAVVEGEVRREVLDIEPRRTGE